MDAIELDAIIDDDGHIIADLPDDAPKGRVRLIIHPIETNETGDDDEATLEQDRALLLAVGVLATAADLGIPDDLEPPDDDELDDLIRSISLGRSIEELIDEERGKY